MPFVTNKLSISLPCSRTQTDRTFLLETLLISKEHNGNTGWLMYLLLRYDARMSLGALNYMTE